MIVKKKHSISSAPKKINGNQNIQKKAVEIGLGSQISSYIEYLRFEKLLLKNTILSYGRDLAKFRSHLQKNKDIDFKYITKPQIIDFLKYLYSSQNEVSVSRTLSTMRGFYKFLIRHQIISENPFLGYLYDVIPRGIHRTSHSQYTKASDILSHYINRALNNEVSINDAINQALIEIKPIMVTN